MVKYVDDEGGPEYHVGRRFSQQDQVETYLNGNKVSFNILWNSGLDSCEKDITKNVTTTIIWWKCFSKDEFTSKLIVSEFKLTKMKNEYL